MKKIFLMLMIFSLILTVNVAFAENETAIQDVYVSVEGSDSLGNGSFDNPYQTLDYTIEKASNNSNIYLKSGVYNSTGYEIVNKSISITGIGEVTVDGGNGRISQNIFMVNNASTLVLNNIKFVNGYADIEGSLSPIVNEGNLFIYNSSFNDFSTINGAIKNLNYLHVNNVTTSNLEILWNVIYGNLPSGAMGWIESELQHKPSGEFLTNMGIGEIYNSQILSGVYNGKNIKISNSNIKEFISNNKSSQNYIFSQLDNSFIHLLRILNSNLLIINNSIIDSSTLNSNDPYHKIENANIFFYNTTIATDMTRPNFFVGIYYSNFTAISSVINPTLAFKSSNINISYSTILNELSFATNSVGTVNYNWWGNNHGPRIVNSETSKVICNSWIVMGVNYINSTFIVDFTKYTNGGNIVTLPNSYMFSSRFVELESESGKFIENKGYLVNGTFKSALKNNLPDTIIYASVDYQVLRWVVGSLADYEIYVSDNNGNDYFNDGSFEYPYKTLSKAVSKSFSGTKIYVMSGNYTLSWNADLKISKNLTFIGMGDVTILRPNARNIFIVDSKGILNLENLNFTVATYDMYYEPLILLDSGNLNIKHCNFHDISSVSVIMAKSNKYINIDGVSFNNIRGPAILGFAENLFVNNSTFSNGKTILLPNYMYGWDNEHAGSYGDHHIFFYIALTGNMTIQNSKFINNTAGAVGHFTFSIIHEFWNFKGRIGKLNTFIYNSTFEDNNWDGELRLIIGLEIGSIDKYFTNGYSVIDGCTFRNNIGHMFFSTIVNNSTFINNTATPYLLRNNGYFHSYAYYIYPKALMVADLINNSYFYGNSYLSNDFEEKILDTKEVYYSSFINNSAAYGGALYNPKEVHYCVFVNNSATYEGNDIFVYKGNLNASSNWWGSNQKPGIDRVRVFIGDLIIDDWVIMSLDYKNGCIIASLNNLLDDNRSINRLNYILPSREAIFSCDFGILNPKNSYLINNQAISLLFGNTSNDFDVFARIDNQNLSLTIYNDSTQIIVKNMTLYGNDNSFDVTLINVNGHRISNQVLNVIIYKENILYDSFDIITDEKGYASFNIDFPIGNYSIHIFYSGNGYFDKSNQTASVNILSISTMLTSYNYTYYGKNNKFYAILKDKTGRYVLNQNLKLEIYSNNKLISEAYAKTGIGGRANVLLSLDAGIYKLKWIYEGNEWYGSSISESVIEIRPINTTINLLNTTFYGKGNDYQFTFKDAYGTLIDGELITLTLSDGNESKEYKLITEKGIASININLEPGVYSVNAKYVGDEVYESSQASAILNIKPIHVTFDLNSHSIIPENGIFTAIMVDMYGKKVSGENVTLEIYDDGLLKTYNTMTNAYGEANFKIDLPEGIYFAILYYCGNTWYEQANGASKITINPSMVLNNIYIHGNDFIQYYGENKYYVIDFNDSNAFSLEGKIIQVSISSGDWFKSYNVDSDVFGKARLQITLDPGIYNITYKYVNEYYGIRGEGSNSIIVNKMPTSLLASDSIMNHDESRYYEIKLVDNYGNPLPNLIINVTVDEKTFPIATNQNGIAKLLLNLDLGYHNITYSFNNEYYGISEGKSKILVVNSTKTGTKIISSDIKACEGELIEYNVLLSDSMDVPIMSSEIILNITDADGNFVGLLYEFTNQTGIAKFNFNLNYGSYILNTYYKGNDKYLECHNTNKINVKARENVTETILFGDDFNIINGDNNTNYFVILSTIDGEFIKNQEIEFIVKNNSYYSSTDDSGKAYLNVPFTPGSYKVVARFNGSNNLTKASLINYISVNGQTCYLYSKDVVKYFNNATHYFVALFDANNLPLSNKIIMFNVSGQLYNRITDDEGFACFEINLLPGIYNISAIYQGDYLAEFARVNNSITVLTTISGEDGVNYANTNLPITFLNDEGNLLINAEVYFVVNNLAYRIKTNSEGIGVFNINLKSGNYNVTAINPNSGENKTFNLCIISTISAKNLVKYYKSSSKFKAKFLNKNGGILKNTKVKFTINRKLYSVKTNTNGFASLKINLKPGKYKITTINTNTNEKITNTVVIKKTIISKDKVVKFSKKTNFKVKILNSNGKIVKNAKVKFKVKGKLYTVKTNSKGFAVLNIKLQKGKYVVSTIYNGLAVKNKITVK